MVVLGGTGVAAFHPQASARAVLAVDTNRQGAMAVFVSAGTLGFALGPTYFSLIAGRWGLSQLLWAAIPGVLVTLLSQRRAPGHRGPGTPRTARL